MDKSRWILLRGQPFFTHQSIDELRTSHLGCITIESFPEKSVISFGRAGWSRNKKTHALAAFATLRNPATLAPTTT